MILAATTACPRKPEPKPAQPPQDDSQLRSGAIPLPRGQDDPAWVAVSAADSSEPTGLRWEDERGLAMFLTTLSTDPATVKVRGVRTAQSVPLRGGATDAFELGLTMQWTSSTNGSYLSMDLVLCPTATNGDPMKEPDWLRFAYVGVPPGRMARALLEQCRSGRREPVHTEGWPQENRQGREVERSRVVLRATQGSSGQGKLEVEESGRGLVAQEPWAAPFDAAYVYLVETGHSNYPTRTVWFADLSITRR